MPTQARTLPDARRQPPRTCTSDGWCGSLGDYSAIWGSSLFDIWIAANHVGSNPADPSAPETSALLHWDGFEWTTVEPLDTRVELTSVWGSSAKDVWVSGTPAYVARFDGANWSRTHLHVGAPVMVSAIAGSSPNDVWTGGAGLYHFDGSDWLTQPIERTGWVTSIWSTPGEIWTVSGGFAQRSRDAGKSWYPDVPPPSPNTPPPAYTWSAVWGAEAGAPFIAGLNGALGRWQNDGWVIQSVSGPGDPPSFRAISGLSSSDVWAVGDYGAAAHWNGVSWTLEGAATRESLRGVWGTDGRMFAVGEHGAFVELRSMESVSNEASTSEIKAIWGAAPNDAWALGEDSAHWDGASWSTVSALKGLSLAGAWGSAPTNVWAIGSGGLVLRFDGASWVPLTTLGTSDLTGIWGSGASDIWAVDASGKFFHFDGTSWASVATEDFGPLAAISGTRPDNVIAVGDVSRARFDGRAWQRLPDNPREHPHYFSAFGDGSNVFMGGMVTWGAYKAGGAHPELGRWNGTTGFDDLEPMWNGDAVVKCGWASTATDVWIALPTLLRWNGNDWVRAALRQSAGVTAIGATSADLWIAVTGGQILRKARN